MECVLSFKADIFKTLYICIKLQNLTDFIKYCIFFRNTDKILVLLSHTILPNNIQILTTARVWKPIGFMITDSLTSQPIYPRETDSDTLWTGGVVAGLDCLWKILLLLPFSEHRSLPRRLPKPPSWRIVPSRVSRLHIKYIRSYPPYLKAVTPSAIYARAILCWQHQLSHSVLRTRCATVNTYDLF